MSELDKHITLENFERLYSEYKPRFIIIARSYIRNNMAAEDIVTDSFLYFWENKDKLNITTTIQAYILGSVKHGCLEWLRNQKNRLKIQQQIHTTAYRSIKAKITVLESTNPEASFTAEIKSIIESQINKMPEPMRQIFLYNRFEGQDLPRNRRNYRNQCAQRHSQYPTGFGHHANRTERLSHHFNYRPVFQRYTIIKKITIFLRKFI